MPELPEVETVRRRLTPHIVNRTITAVDARTEHRYAGTSRLLGATLTRLERRGKFLLAPTDRHHLVVIHLGMTGQLWLDQSPPDHHVVTVTFDPDTALIFRDVRRFGHFTVIDPDDRERFPLLSRLGADPLDPHFDSYRCALHLTGRRRSIKTLLLDQTVIAGIGNYIADETLWISGIHPQAHSLTTTDALRVVTTTLSVIEASLRHGGHSARDYRHPDGSTGTFGTQLRCYGRRGRPCARCSTLLEHCFVAGRGTTWCPRCQPAPP